MESKQASRMSEPWPRSGRGSGMSEREQQVWAEIRHLAVELDSEGLRDSIRAEARRDEEAFAYLFDAIRRLVECCEGAGRLSWEGEGLIARLQAIEQRLARLEADMLPHRVFGPGERRPFQEGRKGPGIPPPGLSAEEQKRIGEIFARWIERDEGRK